MQQGLSYKMRFYIVSAAEFISVFIYVLVAFVLKQGPMGEMPKDADPGMIKTLLYVFIFISLAHIQIMLFFKNMIRNGKEKGEMPLQKELSLWIVHNAFAIAPSIFGLLLFILSRDINYMYYFGGYSICLFILMFPRGDFLEEKQD